METGSADNVPGSFLFDAMAIAVLSQVKRALSNLNPAQVREEAERPVIVGLVAASAESLGRMETYFAPPHLSPSRRAQSVRMLVRGSASGCDVEIYESSLLRPGAAFSFDTEAPDDCVRRILRARDDLAIAARPQPLPVSQVGRASVDSRHRQGERAVLSGYRSAGCRSRPRRIAVGRR